MVKITHKSGPVNVAQGISLIEEIKLKLNDTTLPVKVLYDSAASSTVISSNLLPFMKNPKPLDFFTETITGRQLINGHWGGLEVSTNSGENLKIQGVVLDIKNGLATAKKTKIPVEWQSTHNLKEEMEAQGGLLSIIFGNDVMSIHPTPIDISHSGLALYKSKITQNLLLCGRVHDEDIEKKNNDVNNYTTRINNIEVKIKKPPLINIISPKKKKVSKTEKAKNNKTKNTGDHQSTAAGDKESTLRSETKVPDVPGGEHHGAVPVVHQDQGAPALHLQPAPAVHDGHGEDEPQPEQRAAHVARVARANVHTLGAVPVLQHTQVGMANAAGQPPHQEEAAGPPLHIPGDHDHEDNSRGAGGRGGPRLGRPPDPPGPISMVKNCKVGSKK